MQMKHNSVMVYYQLFVEVRLLVFFISYHLFESYYIVVNNMFSSHIKSALLKCSKIACISMQGIYAYHKMYVSHLERKSQLLLNSYMLSYFDKLAGQLF